MNIVALELKNIGSDVDVSKFNELGNLTTYSTTKPEEIYEKCKDADVIIMNKLPINESTIGNLNKVKIVLVTATGTDNIDIGYCKSRGIAVCNVKGYSTDSVVQHTFALMFYLSENLKHYDEYVKNGEYCKTDIFTYFGRVFYELKGKTWGIVGLGDIGRGVAKIADAFGCNVIYYSTSGKNSNSDYRRVSFDELLSEADIISIHSPLTENTRYLFNKDAFEKMKKSAYLINVGRGPIINEEDLTVALENDVIAGAALDVICKEPMDENSPLLRVKDSGKLVITPHIAWATFEARTRLMDEVYLNLKAFINGEEPRNRVDIK